MAVIRKYNPGAMPPATLVMVAINVAIALIDMFNDGLLERSLCARGIDVYYGQWWRLLGNAFVHGSLMHIAFNAYGIWILGRLFEGLQGWKAFLLVYFASAIGGSALGLVFYDPDIPALGASGAAYGLMGAVLGFFYVKTGSIKGIWQVPISRQLAVWFLIGIGVSLAPGISLLAHLGGFIPGVILGIYLEYRYSRKADMFHHASAGVVLVLVLGFAVYAVYPWHRGNLYAGRALAAYQRDDMQAGDALVQEAARRGVSGGGSLLLQHLQLWRKYHALNPKSFNQQVLLWPVTHGPRDPRLRRGAWDYLAPTDIVTGELETSSPEPLDRPATPD